MVSNWVSLLLLLFLLVVFLHIVAVVIVLLLFSSCDVRWYSELDRHKLCFSITAGDLDTELRSEQELDVERIIVIFDIDGDTSELPAVVLCGQERFLVGRTEDSKRNRLLSLVQWAVSCSGERLACGDFVILRGDDREDVLDSVALEGLVPCLGCLRKGSVG